MNEKMYSHWIWKVLGALLLALIAWGVISWFEVICKNTTPDPQYWEYNLILLFTLKGV